jgi:hypothetical protein
LHHRRADRSTDAYFVAPRLATAGRSLLRSHAVRVGVGWVSAHPIVGVNRRVWLRVAGYNHVCLCVVADSGAAVESAGFGVRRSSVARPGLFELPSR